MSITRRLFLRTTAAGAASAAVTAPVVAEAQRPMTRHEQAIYHIRELERLTYEDGSLDCHIFVCGHYDEYVEGRTRDVRMIGIWSNGVIKDPDRMFRSDGAAS